MLKVSQSRNGISGFQKPEKDGRTVRVIIHHVASVYPVEIQVARAVASGTAVTDVTWDAVAAMNANHAREHASPDKADTLELLVPNSREAAAAARQI